MEQILTTRSITNNDITISVILLKRTEKSAYVQIEKGQVVRCKVRKSYNGKEYVMPYGTSLFAPIFYIY